MAINYYDALILKRYTPLHFIMCLGHRECFCAKREYIYEYPQNELPSDDHLLFFVPLYAFVGPLFTKRYQIIIIRCCSALS